MKPGIDSIGVCVVFCCTDGAGRFLLSKRGPGARDEQGAWEFGSGKVEFGETLEEALARELREEYGCAGEIIEALPARTLLREKDGVRTHWLTLPYIVRVNPDEVRHSVEENVEEVAWFRLDEFPSPLHTGAKAQIETDRVYYEKHARGGSAS